VTPKAANPEGASAQARVRGGNRRDVLQLVLRGQGRATRAGVARATGLTSATISSIVAELVDSELVEHAGRADSTGGKPATSLRIRTDAKVIGAMIIRHHSIRAAVVDLEGTVLHEIPRILTPLVVTLEDIRAAVSALVAESRLPLIGIGIDLPGALLAGHVVESIQLRMHDVYLTHELADLAPCPIFLINDAQADALREYSLDPPGDETLFSLSLGIGVGGAAILGGEPHSGPRSRAGEIGHVRVDFSDDASQCDCGRFGCLEQLVALPRLLDIDDERLVDSDNPSVLALPVNAKTTLASQLLARALILVCATVDARTVVINGAAPRLGPEFLAALQADCDALTPIGTELLRLRYATGAIELPFRGAAEHVLRKTLGVNWSH
jgi:predicted NBD/HSP70 family sugar kinase